MKFTFSWLKRFLGTNLTAEEIGAELTLLGLELESLVDNSEKYAPFIVAEIISAAPHPDAESLRVCNVYDGANNLQIVCGAPNARAGIKIVLAPIGSIIPANGLKIKLSKIRGVESNGMLCSSDELDIGGDSEGIIELPADAVVGSSFAKLYGLDDQIFDIAITPNRSDCLGVYGIARDLAAKGAGVLKEIDTEGAAADFVTDLQIENHYQEACPFFVGFEVRQANQLASPAWLKAFLTAAGCKPISSLVDITNYICLTFGQPMHSYDADYSGRYLEIASAGKQTSEFMALNDKTYKLEEEDIVINDARGPACIAGIMGGKLSSCTDNTTNAIIECAIFDQSHIIRTGRRLMIDSNARYRFERGVDEGFTLKAAKIAAAMFKEIAEAEVSNLVVKGQSSAQPVVISFDAAFLKRKTSITLETDEIVKILCALGIECEVKNDIIYGTIPSWRHDISIAEDLVEEVVRIYGYNNLPARKLLGAECGTLSEKQRRINDTKYILSHSGYQETVSWSFMHSKYAKYFTDLDLKDALYIQNPISDVLDYMRPSILPNLLGFISKNIARSSPNLSFFEIGPVFEGGNENVYTETIKISAVRTGAAEEKTVYGPERTYDVYDVKRDVQLLLAEFGIAVDKLAVKLDELPNYYHPGRSARLVLGKVTLAIFGEVHPEILELFDLKQRVLCFEVMLEHLPAARKKKGARPDWTPSDFQPVSRDFAFVMPKHIAVGEVLSKVQSLDRTLVKSVKLFDIYEGPNVESGTKSVAFNVILQSDTDTLTDNQINDIAGKIEFAVTSSFGATLRR